MSERGGRGGPSVGGQTDRRTWRGSQVQRESEAPHSRAKSYISQEAVLGCSSFIVCSNNEIDLQQRLSDQSDEKRYLVFYVCSIIIN